MDIQVLNMRKTSEISILSFKKVYLMKKPYLGHCQLINFVQKKNKNN